MKVTCPTCKKEVEWCPENTFRPFCCKRCQLIDLGEWAEEKHAIPVAPDSPQGMDIDPEAIEEMLHQQDKGFFND